MTIQLAEHPEVQSAIDLLVAWIEAQVVHRELPGLAIGIVHDQALLWGRGFGWADVERGEPATVETLYRIGSITKLFTATAILILRDAGKLGLDDPITDYLPWFAMKSASPEAGPITIRHLLTHTAGLPREAAFPYWTDDRFPTVAEISARLPMQERPLPTESRWKYSNLGAVLRARSSPRSPTNPTPTSSGARSSSRSGCPARWSHRRRPAIRGWPPATDAGCPGAGGRHGPSPISGDSPRPGTWRRA